MNGRRSQGSAAGGTGGEGGELEEELEEYMGSNDSAGSGATMSNHEEGLDPIEGRDDEPLTASQENVDKASKWKGGSTSDTATTGQDNMLICMLRCLSHRSSTTACVFCPLAINRIVQHG